MRVIIATCVGLVALSTISAQAAPLPPSKAVLTELTVLPIVPAANECGYGYKRTIWYDHWGERIGAIAFRSGTGICLAKKWVPPGGTHRDEGRVTSFPPPVSR
jgi:hypothetical protein